MKVEDYLEFGKGKTNLILTAPHAGSLKPVDIPARKYGSLLKDTHTDRIIKYMIKYLEVKPYYVMAKIHRSRVDFNRNMKEGAQTDSYAKGLWRSWYALLDLFVEHCTEEYKNTLLVDIHSHNNGDSFQLGYNLGGNLYADLERARNLKKLSSFGTLDHDTHDMFFGPFSLAVLLETAGYKVYRPRPGEVYFNGGAIIETYGEKIAAVQIEIPVSVGKQSAKVARDLVSAITIFKGKFIKEQQ